MLPLIAPEALPPRLPRPPLGEGPRGAATVQSRRERAAAGRDRCHHRPTPPWSYIK